MPRIPLLHLLAIALCALALGAAPALASTPASAPAASVATDGDDWEDDEDWEDEEEEDDWGDEECFFVDDDGEPLPPEECDEEDWDLCLEGDDEEWEDWSDDEDWGDDECSEDGSEDDAGEKGEGAAPPRLSKLKAKPVRRGGVRVSFRLDRGGEVVLALRRIEDAHASGRCTHVARSAVRGGTPSGRKARRCPRPRTLRGTTTVTGRGGANATTLRDWKGRRLEPGRYRLTATPAAAGGRSATTTFKLKAPGRR